MAQQQAVGDERVDLPWHQENPRRWEVEQRLAGEVLREVECRIEKSKAVIDGTFDLRSTHGYVYESVRIRIEYPAGFPHSGTTPKVTLLSHRNVWKQTPDAHINSDWSLCLYVPGDSRINFGQDDALNSLLAVIQTFLFKEWRFQKDLAKQEITAENAVWLGPARSHYCQGIREALREMPRVGRNAPCPCGSGKKFKVCCIGLQ